MSREPVVRATLFLGAAFLLFFMLASVSMCSRAQQPQMPSVSAMQGRVESLSQSQAAVAGECAARTGQLYEAIERMSAELQAVRKELETLKKK